MKSGHQVGLNLLNLKIFFTSMINYTKFFDFVITIFYNHVFKIVLYIFIKSQRDVTTYKIDYM